MPSFTGDVKPVHLLLVQFQRRKGLAALPVPRILDSHNYFRGVIMTIGIYALYWEEQDLVYVGQSQNIEVRFNEHLYLMKRNKHTNYKVQNAYASHGEPNLVILEVCSILDTNRLEIFWTNELDALNPSTGLCIIEAGAVGWGTNSNSSKYSRIQILKTFSLLYKSQHTIKDICTRTKVPKSTIQDIFSQRTHLWLKDSYPERYAEMILRGRLLSNISKKLGVLPRIVSPEGNIYEIQSITEFCKSIEIDNLCLTSKVRGFARIIDGTRKQYKGWKLVNSL